MGRDGNRPAPSSYAPLRPIGSGRSAAILAYRRLSHMAAQWLAFLCVSIVAFAA